MPLLLSIDLFQAIQKLKSQSSSTYLDPSSSSKQAVVNKQPAIPMYFEYGDFMPPEAPTIPASMKYSELYSVPKNSKYPELCMIPGQYEEAFYPVDTPNIIPTPSPAADFKQIPHSIQKQSDKPEIKYGEDLDLSSLLSLSAPVNDDPESTCLFDNDPLNLFGLQPSLDNLDLIQPTGADSSSPDGIHYWNGVQKECTPSVPTQPDPSASFAGSFYGLPFEDKGSIIPMDTIPTEDPACTDNTLLTMQLEDRCETSPKSELSSPMSGDSMVSSGENWQHNLRDLFEQTFDPSDLEGEYMLPPPNKRQECSPCDTPCWPPTKYEVPSPTPSSPMDVPPETVISTPLLPFKPAIKEAKSSKDKPKHILLFGKDEGEIIEKLLTAETTLPNRPLVRDKLITMPVEEFNQLLEEAMLTEIEVAFMKEWRRRGKNKAAAQVARKRKREEVSGLDEEVRILRQQKVELEKRYDRLRSVIESLKERSLAAEDMLFQKQSKVLMEPVSRHTHHIHVMDDDKLLLIPRISSKILLMNQ